MTDQVLRDALRMACSELAGWRYWYSTIPGGWDKQAFAADDVVAEFLAKARGFPPEGSEGASP